jgi:hypothetical protein
MSTDIFKVVHAKDGVETVYLVRANSSRDAVTQVLDTLYDRHFFRKEDPERLANDPFGLLAAGQVGTWTNTKVMRDHGIAVGVSLFEPDPPYKLYTLDTKTGEMR